MQKIFIQHRPIFKINHLIDSIPFHMETAIVNSSEPNIYNHQSPFMQCSSVEIVKQKIPDLKNTEEWITMIIHEYFHGFQLKHKKFSNFTMNNIFTFRRDSLTNLYKKYDWFKKSVDLENEYLLQIIQEKDTNKIDSLVQHFFIERNARRLKTKEVVNLDLELYEKYYETIEGTARYTEYGFYKTFSEMPQNAAYLPNDTYFQSFKNYQNYQINKDKWLYMTNKTSYLYAIGFNMARAMDKLNIDFKNVLFANETLTLEDIFKSK
ncbi:MAG: hypothetical protein KA327_02555 [Pseudarcicella sp.]|nr:hypothetical protein [Pseudarcicella sp.]